MCQCPSSSPYKPRGREIDCFSTHVGSQLAVNQPKHCVSLPFFNLRTHPATWGTQSRQGEGSLWGYNLSYQDKLSLVVDVHSHSGIPSGQGEQAGRRPTLHRAYSWRSPLMAHKGGLSAESMFTHTCTRLNVCFLWIFVGDGVQYIQYMVANTHVSGAERMCPVPPCDICSARGQFGAVGPQVELPVCGELFLQPQNNIIAPD